MRTCIYRAANALDAHLVQAVLAQHDIEAYIEGEYLQGGIGQIQMLDLIRVVVDAPDVVQAEQIVADWETTPIEPTEMPKRSYLGMIAIGILILLFIGLI